MMKATEDGAYAWRRANWLWVMAVIDDGRFRHVGSRPSRAEVDRFFRLAGYESWRDVSDQGERKAPAGLAAVL